MQIYFLSSFNIGLNVLLTLHSIIGSGIQNRNVSLSFLHQKYQISVIQFCYIIIMFVIFAEASGEL